MPSRTFVTRADCSRHNIFPGVDVFTAAGKEMMLSLAVFEAGAVVEAHSHPHEQIGMVIEGRAVFYVGDEERELGPGDMYFIPGHVVHRVVALGSGCRALDVFHPVREDYV